MEPVIYAQADALLNLQSLMHEMRQQRQCEKAMSDRRFERRLAARALNVHVDPLMVERGIGKLLDALLCHVEPISNGNFLADESFESFRGIEDAFGHNLVYPERSGGTL